MLAAAAWGAGPLLQFASQHPPPPQAERFLPLCLWRLRAQGVGAGQGRGLPCCMCSCGSACPLGSILPTPCQPPLPHAAYQARDPKYGNWLDLYVTVRSPLPPPVSGVLGSTYAARTRAASVTDGGDPIYGGIVWLEAGQEEPTPDVGFLPEDGAPLPPSSA